LYEQVFPSQLGVPVCVSHAAFLQAPQVDVERSELSQPFVFGEPSSQSAQFTAQPVYVHLPPVHAAPRLVFPSHARPQAPQLDVVVVGVSQPCVSGGVGLQSAKPSAQPE
jgi:hypothetical protein